MKWIDFKKVKPKTDIIALVCNSKGWMGWTRAIYQASDDVWTLYDVNYRDTLTLEVTHYIAIPPEPRHEMDLDEG